MNKTTEALKLADKVISRYRNETPIGNQPHMICHIADEALAAIREVLANHSGGANEMVAEPVQILPGGGLVGKAEPVKQHTEQYWLHEINNARADGYERGYMAAKLLYVALSVEAAVLAERKRCAEACYLRAQSWKDNAARAAKLCGDAITSMGDTK